MSLITLKNCLRYAYTKDFLILGCGPSLNDFSERTIDEITGCVGSGKNAKTVIAIKQALLHYPNADIHVMNTCNISDYSDIYESKTSDDNFHSIFQIAYEEIPFYEISKHNTVLPIVNVNRFDQSLSTLKAIEKWSLDKISPRCWGPGLIYETVFYLCEYLGARNIYTIGWDLGKDNTGREHFYSPRLKLANKAQPLEPKETEQEVELSRLFYEWLKSKGCNLYVASKNSNAHKDIPRIDLCV